MKVTELFMGHEPEITGNKIGVELEYCRDGGDWEAIGMDVNNEWRFDHDGSLGRGGIELVMTQPRTLDTTFKHLKLLEKSFKKRDAVIRDSVTAGVHVHINVGDLQLKELFNFMTLYMVMEGPLVDWCGDDRVGNLFCLRATDAYALVPMLSRAVRQKDWGQFTNDDLRYGSMNVCSIPRYGSLEFRAMKSTTDFKLIRAWVKMLVRCKNAAIEYGNPQEIIEDFSRIGPEAMLDKVFKSSAFKLKECDFGYLMMEGMLAAQDLAYSIDDWNKHLDIKPNTNPFEQGVAPPRPRGRRVGMEVPNWMRDLNVQQVEPRPAPEPEEDEEFVPEQDEEAQVAEADHFARMEERRRERHRREIQEAMEQLRRQARPRFVNRGDRNERF